MTPERWKQVTEVFHTALTHDTSTRGEYLDRVCGDDCILRSEVDAMLAAHGNRGDFGEHPLDAAVDDEPRLATGELVGAYRVERLIGAGGMGEVYKARDARLGRDVALKVLPAAFTSDPERLARLEREARLLAALNHPHIAAIYGFEEAGNVRALILELVDGDTLADRLSRGPIPLKQALAIAQQIASALEDAHEKGIIHRDLKPANVKVTPAGIVKVLDFGLARAHAGTVAESERPISRAITTAVRNGAPLGTPSFMSPEQARGEELDKRADIWAFGCVLFEMLTGRRTFPGDTLSDTIAAVLSREPDWSALPADTPPIIRRLVQRCLAKECKERLPDIAVARMDIGEALAATGPSPGPMPVSIPTRRRSLTPAALVAGIFALTMAAGVTLWTTRGPAQSRVVRFRMTPPFGPTTFVTYNSNGPPLAISRDGIRLAYRGPRQIFVRALQDLEPAGLLDPGALQGAGETTSTLFFSPDGQWIGFFDRAILKKVAVGGGRPSTLTSITGVSTGASWSDDDRIIFATNDIVSGLLSAAATGGDAEVLTKPDPARGELDHWWPEVLPGGRTVLFTVTSADAPDKWQIAVLDMTTRHYKILIRGGSHARYAAPGYLVYGVRGTLHAAPFDLTRLEVTGPAVPVLGGVGMSGMGGIGMSVSDDGTLVYVPVPADVASRDHVLVWVDRNGREEPLKAPPRGYVYPRLSADGTRVALDVGGGVDGRDIWIWDIARETLTRLTTSPHPEGDPVWSPDGQRVVFSSRAAGPRNLFWQAANGGGAVEQLTHGPDAHFGNAFSFDGKHLVFRVETAATGSDLMVLSFDGEERTHSASGTNGAGTTSTHGAKPLVKTAFNELNAEISPDSRWIAYQSDESGREEVYVRPFPDVNGGRWQISTHGGAKPLWARSGKEIFYVEPDGGMMSVAIERGSALRASMPIRLFAGRYRFDVSGRTYDVSADGRRFLMIKEDEVLMPNSMVVVQHWDQELKRLAPTR